MFKFILYYVEIRLPGGENKKKKVDEGKENMIKIEMKTFVLFAPIVKEIYKWSMLLACFLY